MEVRSLLSEDGELIKTPLQMGPSETIRYLAGVYKASKPTQAWRNDIRQAFFHACLHRRAASRAVAGDNLMLALAISGWPIVKLHSDSGVYEALCYDIKRYNADLAGQPNGFILSFAQVGVNGFTTTSVSVPWLGKARWIDELSKAGITIEFNPDENYKPSDAQKGLLDALTYTAGDRVYVDGPVYSGCPDELSPESDLARDELSTLLQPLELRTVQGPGVIDTEVNHERPGDVFVRLKEMTSRVSPIMPMLGKVLPLFDGDKLHKAKPEEVAKYVPITPLRCITLLQQNCRGYVDVRNLEDMPYRPAKECVDQLVIKDDAKQFAHDFLNSSPSDFMDFTPYKSQGSNIMLSGPPGVGKTLLAEAICEGLGKPILFVQCAFLGVNPIDVERRLLAVAKRAERFNGALLLDDADPYICSDTADLNKAAITSTVLNFMERHNTLAFITTNNPDKVNPAVSSRCFVRMAFTHQSREQLILIATRLAEWNGVKFAPNVLEMLFANPQNLSGRDVAQFIKLCRTLRTKGTLKLTRARYLFHTALGIPA